MCISEDVNIFHLAAAAVSQLTTRVSNVQRDVTALTTYSRTYIAKGKLQKFVLPVVLISTFTSVRKL